MIKIADSITICHLAKAVGRSVWRINFIGSVYFKVKIFNCKHEQITENLYKKWKLKAKENL